MKKRRVSFPSDKELIDRINNNDSTAKNILCQKYINKCHKIAAEYQKKYPAIGNKDDFFSIAIEVLARAIDSFNYSHSLFDNYFSTCIEHCMARYIGDNYDRKIFEKQVLSLDYLYDDGSCLHDACGTVDINVQQNLLKDTFIKFITDPKNNFKEKEARVILLFLDGYSIQEIANIMEIRYSSAHRYYTISLNKLRRLLSKKR